MATKNYNISRIANDSFTRYAIEDVSELPVNANTRVIYRMKNKGVFRYYNYIDGWHEILTDASEITGTGGSQLVITMVSPQLQTVAKGTAAPIIYHINSEGANSAVVEYKIGGVPKYSEVVSTGTDIHFDTSPYIKSGTNLIEVNVIDNLGRVGKVMFNINVVLLEASSNFDDTKAYTGEIPVYFKVSGSVSKTSHVKINGVEYPEYDITAVDNSRVITLNNLHHGVHTLEIYAEATINNTKVYSNTLTYKIIYVNGTSVLISSKFDKKTVEEGELISIDYIVHSPEEYTEVSFLINNEVSHTASVSREKQYWNVYTYPVGDVTFTIKANDVQKDFEVHVTEFKGNAEIEQEGLELELTPEGKTNSNLLTRNTWESSVGDITGVLQNFNFGSNGWINPANERPYLRINGNASVQIPFKVFSSNINTTGKTVEIEFATRNISDLNKELLTCFGSSRGIKIYPTTFSLRTQNNLVNVRFKDNEILKVSIAIEPENADRLIRTYINGVFSGLYQYDSDKFTHEGTINIVGDIDIYSIRVYNTVLTNTEVLMNYIADLPIQKHKIKLANNDIYNDDGTVSFDKVYTNTKIPTLIVTGVLPLTKGDKRTVRATYHNPTNPNYDFDYTEVTWDVQGTSSVMYPRKNWKGKFPESFAFTDNAIAEDTYTFKADYMESSHSHNTGNAKLVNAYAPLFPTQEPGNNVRNSINGFPILMFHKENDDSAPVYQGVYNFNNDKGNADTLGLTTTKAESWEFKNNTSDLCLFKTDVFSNDVSADLEARYPDKYKNYDAIKTLWSWVYSTADGSEESLRKFRAGFEDHFNLDACLFYYVMMDIMLATDSRAKNMFLDTVDGVIWYPRWYDIDTTYGLDNEGHYKFDPVYEQTDRFGSGYVYNGHDSVLWNNFGTEFEAEIAEYYVNLRKNGMTYDNILNILQTQQIDIISEAMYNSDAEFKYVYPIIRPEDFKLEDLEGNPLPNDTYAYVAQGSRLNQLQWWLAQRLSYLDSKYEHPAYLSDYITLRAYSETGSATLPSIEITQYIAGYCKIKYGSHDTVYRLSANTPTLIEAPTEFDPNDTETFIYGASKILDLGDLSHLYPGTVDISRASKLKNLTLGAGAGYVNTNLTALTVGNSSILESIDIRGCVNLTGALNLSGCPNIKTVRASNTQLAQIIFGRGGNLEIVNLPSTITALELVNQASITEFTIDSYDNLQTLRIENCPTINSKAILNAAYDTLESAYVNNIDWVLTKSEIILLDRLSHCDLHGTIKIAYAIGKSHLQRLRSMHPNIVFDAPTTLEDYTVTFYDYKGDAIYYASVLEGEDASYEGNTPTRPDFEGYSYTFWKWDKTLTNIRSNLDVHPEFLYNKPTTFTVELSDNNTAVTFNLYNIEGCIFNINWGDNTQDTWTTSTPLHNYQNSGVYTITVQCTYSTGAIPSINFELCKQYIVGDLYIQDVFNEFHITDARITSCIFPKAARTSEIVNCVELETLYINKHFANAYLNDFSKSTNLHNIYYNGDIESWCNLRFTSFINVPSQHGVSVKFINNAGEYETLTTLVIPDTVTELNSYSFYKFTSLEEITIPQNVTLYGTNIFTACDNIHTVTLHNTNNIYTNYAYHSCLYRIFQTDTPASVKTVNILPTTDTINTYAFHGCANLTKVVLPDTIISIKDFAFSGCTNLNYINLPETLNSLSSQIFSGCSNIYRLDIPENVTEIPSNFAPDCYIGILKIPSSISVINEHAFTACNVGGIILNDNDSFVIHENILYDSAKETLILAEVNCGESVTIPSTVHTIWAYAFYKNYLRYITFPTSLKYIEDYAFAYCANLLSVILPKNIEQLGNYAFRDCVRVHTIDLSACIKLNTIPKYAFHKCCYYPTEGIQEYKIILNDSIKIIKEYAFTENQRVSSISLPSNLEEIGDYAFSNTSITSLTIPSTVTSIGKRTFYNCKALTSAIFGMNSNVTQLTDSIFTGCDKMNYIELPQNLESIEQYAFSGCSLLASVTLPNSVSSIGSSAFYNCSKLEDINIPEGITTIEPYTFYDCYSLSSITIPSTVTSIGGHAFYNCSKLEDINIPEGITTIEPYTFQYCSKLSSITIPSTVTSIGERAFSSCSALTSVDLPQSLVTIDAHAFSSCKLTSIVIPASVTNIGNGAFAYNTFTNITIDNSNPAYTSIANIIYNIDKTTLVCAAYSITTLDVPSTVTAIASYACAGCSMLTQVVFNNTNTIGANAFLNCNNLQVVQFGEALEIIGPSAFCECISLVYVNLPANIHTIGSSAFSGCSQLTSINIPDSVTSIGSSAFYECSKLEYTMYDTYLKYLGDVTNPYKVLIGASSTNITSCRVHADTKLVATSALYNSTLRNIYILSRIPFKLNSQAFYSSANIYVPTGTLNTYKQSVGWATYKLMEA